MISGVGYALRVSSDRINLHQIYQTVSYPVMELRLNLAPSSTIKLGRDGDAICVSVDGKLVMWWHEYFAPDRARGVPVGEEPGIYISSDRKDWVKATRSDTYVDEVNQDKPSNHDEAQRAVAEE